MPRRPKQRLESAHRFLEHIYQTTDPVVCFQTFKNAPNFNGFPQWQYGTLRESADWLVRENDKGAGIYWMVNRGNGEGRSLESVIEVCAVFVDLDGAPLDPVALCPSPPHAILESSPERYQAFWRVKDCPLDYFSPVQSALAERFGGDPAIKDLPRVMRVPGFLHLKGEPWRVKVIGSLSEHPTYKLNDLLDSLKLELDESEIYAGNPTQHGDIQLYKKGDRNRSLVTVSARLRNAGLDPETLLNTLREVNKKQCIPPVSEKEVQRIAGWALEKEAKPIRPARSGGGNLPPLSDKHYSFRQQDSQAPKCEPQIMSWQELDQCKISPAQWVIKDLLPEGLCILAGRPKAGKSWLVQSLCLDVAQGDKALGEFLCNQGSVLSLALEDSPRRFKDRMRRILRDRETPECAYFTTEWPLLPECIDSLDKWLRGAGNPKLVAIDTLAKIRPADEKSSNVYERDYAHVAILQKLAAEHQIAIIVVHHERKGKNESDDEFNAISGSAGITGAADTLMILRRDDRTQMSGQLIVSGRDINDKKLALTWDAKHCLWLYEGDLRDVKLAKLKQLIIDTIRESDKPVTIEEMVKLIKKGRGIITDTVNGLTRDNVIEKSVSGKGYIMVQNADDQDSEEEQERLDF